MNTFILLVGMCLTSNPAVTNDCVAVYVRPVQAVNLEACKFRAYMMARAMFIATPERPTVISNCRVPGERKS